MLAGLIAADQHGWLLYDRNAGRPLNARDQQRRDRRLYDGQRVQVVRVIDGDTLEINRPDGDQAVTRVRLLGVDAPEAARVTPEGQTIPAEPLAERSGALAESLAGDRVVRLELDPNQTRGFYGRLLAYVVLDDGSRLGEHMLSAGLARTSPRWPHPHTERYHLLQLSARRDGLGLWADP
ncbi:MAG: hypothetical protein GVY24_05915 [Planctomycetes bacterium]|nr:hypothetical protein [Planctomycetota bacterium]